MADNKKNAAPTIEAQERQGDKKTTDCDKQDTDNESIWSEPFWTGEWPCENLENFAATGPESLMNAIVTLGMILDPIIHQYKARVEILYDPDKSPALSIRRYTGDA